MGTTYRLDYDGTLIVANGARSCASSSHSCAREVTFDLDFEAMNYQNDSFDFRNPLEKVAIDINVIGLKTTRIAYVFPSDHSKFNKTYSFEGPADVPLSFEMVLHPRKTQEHIELTDAELSDYEEDENDGDLEDNALFALPPPPRMNFGVGAPFEDNLPPDDECKERIIDHSKTYQFRVAKKPTPPEKLLLKRTIRILFAEHEGKPTWCGMSVINTQNLEKLRKI